MCACLLFATTFTPVPSVPTAVAPPDVAAVVKLLQQAAATAVGRAQAETCLHPEHVQQSVQQQIQEIEAHVAELAAAAAAARAPFSWVDGPLVVAMRHGDMILVDEVNLAEDAVLERLNR